MKRSSLALAMAVASAAAALVWTAAVPATITAAQASCGTFAGPGWSFVDPFKRPPNQKGTTWKVIATRVPCSFATMWAKKLVKTPFKGEALTSHG